MFIILLVYPVKLNDKVMTLFIILDVYLLCNVLMYSIYLFINVYMETHSNVIYNVDSQPGDTKQNTCN